ncbi:MAG: response regulator, partial [Fibrobacter sp.]|nr:response regulator [Fibrobacter sp.]
MNTLLLVDDNLGLREQMKWSFLSDYTVFEAGNSTECIAQFQKNKPEIVLLDMGLDNIPDKGLELLDSILEIERTAKVIVITANTSGTLGLESVKRGAFDFLIKPVNMDNLKVVMERALRIKSLEQASSKFSSSGKFQIENNVFMLGESDSMKRIFELI